MLTAPIPIGLTMPSTRKIAEQAGVSVGTVSRVLNNKNGVSDDVRRRVLQVAQQLNYSLARRNPLQRVSLTHIGLLVRPLGEILAASPFYADVYHGVEQICSELRINLYFGSVDSVEDRVRNLPTLVGDERIGGLVLVGAMAPSVVERLAAACQLPLVLIDNWYANCRWDSVMLDNAQGIAEATERLIELGHREIVFISGPDHPSIVERCAGYRSVMQEHGLSSRIVHVSELDIAEGDSAAEEVAGKLPQTTAVVCSNDMQAFGVMRRLAQLGYHIPEDISVVGFDDVSMAALTYPPLTTVHVDRLAFGRLAVELLLSRVQSPNRPPVRCTMSVKFIERASMGPPRRPRS
jgi:DNA-binding LacI/PurR family transcriptional regulator